VRRFIGAAANKPRRLFHTICSYERGDFIVGAGLLRPA
jgi:hypothetical protein